MRARVAAKRSMRLLLVSLALPGCFLFRRDDPRCPTDRTIEIASDEDARAFAGCKHANGVSIHSGAPIDLHPLHELEEITGDLAIGPTVGIEDATFDSLRVVGGAIRVDNNTSLHGLFLPLVEHAARVEIDRNASLTAIAAPRLSAVTGAVVITDNHLLELLDLNELHAVGGELVVGGQPKLRIFIGSRLQAQSVQLDDHAKAVMGAMLGP